MRDGITLKQAVQGAQVIDAKLSEHGFDEETLEDAAKQGYVNSCFEIDSEGLLDVVKEFYPTEINDVISSHHFHAQNGVETHNLSNI